MLGGQAGSVDNMPNISKPTRLVRNNFNKRFGNPGVVISKKVTEERKKIKLQLEKIEQEF